MASEVHPEGIATRYRCSIEMELSIIIVNWNSRDYLEKCLASIYANTVDIAFEIIVIDSGSFDGADRMIKEQYAQVKFIQSAANLGFAKANNRAFDASVGKCVMFLNPDTEIAGPAINALHSALNLLPRAGAVGCKLLNADGTIQSTSIRSIPTILNRVLDSDSLRRQWPRSRLWGMAPLFEVGTGAREVEAISGACVILKRDAFLRVGRFTEEYFMYAEDIDLSYKLRKGGYLNYYVPTATVIHYGGSSSKESESTFSAVMMPEATRRFLQKTRGARYARCYRGAMCAAAVARLIILAIATVVSSRRRSSNLQGSFRKWLAVLRWSLNRDRLVKRYYPISARRAS